MPRGVALDTDRTLGRPLPRRGLLMALPLGLAGLTAACSKASQPKAPGVAEVGVVTLTAGAVTISSELTGRVVAAMSAQVRPQVAGVVQARLFKEGGMVKAGQPLYQIDPRPFRAAHEEAAASLESARASLVTAQAKADRYGRLSDLEAVSKQDIDDTVASARQAKASVRQNEAALETAKINLAYTKVYAPISGRIGRSSVTPGALVTASQTDALATIQQLDPIFVDITQSSQQLLQLRRGLAKGSVLPATAEVTLKLEDGSTYDQAGTIEFSEVSVDEDAGTVVLRARFPNPDGLLLPGMFVRVETPQGVAPNAILAPQQGITRDAKGQATALIVDAGDQVVQRDVTAAQAVGDKWLITSGLKAGDRLIVEGVDKVAAGSKVKAAAVTLTNEG
ncbi:MAG: efflux RND transporter periplasmic adaptor subunit [Caulobacter sp.]